MTRINDEIKNQLLSMQDADYKEFHQKLMPTVDNETIIGIRVPQLRKIAKGLAKNDSTDEFLKDLPHRYYEENNLHAFIIEQIRDYDLCIEEVKIFLPFVDNWATCDSMRPKCFLSHTDELLLEIETWIKSEHTYTLRFAIEMLMCYYLDDKFDPRYHKMVAKVKSDEHYVNMMIAWYFATALAKQYEATLPYLTERKFSQWVHNKTIQKAVESYRITDEQKEYLKTLKWK